MKVVPTLNWERSGRVLDSRPRGRRFEPHQHHCLSPRARHINPSLVLVQPRKTRPYITERLLMGRKESNQTKTNIKFKFESIIFFFQSCKFSVLLCFWFFLNYQIFLFEIHGSTRITAETYLFASYKMHAREPLYWNSAVIVWWFAVDIILHAYMWVTGSSIYSKDEKICKKHDK